jgi:peptidoglycan/LPS O-acetylase OafA/YrhL
MNDSTTLMRWVTLLGCIDSFAVGGLVAYLGQAQILRRMWQSESLLFAMPLIAGACFFLGRALMTLPENSVWLALTESVDAVFLAWVLAASLSGMKARYARILSWAPLVYLGKISYGIYVYHVFIIILVSPLLVPYGLTEDHNAFGRIAVLLGLTLVMSSLSWHWLEQPFMAWKKSMSSGQKRVPSPAPQPEPSRVTPFAPQPY